MPSLLAQGGAFKDLYGD